MDYRIIGATVSSALLYACALAIPGGQFLTFIFLTPLILVSSDVRYTLSAGFGWGIVFFSIHWIEFFHIIQVHAAGRLKYGALILLIMYMSLFSMAWLWAASKVCYQQSAVRRASVWIAITYLYFLWMSTGVWWIFGIYNGYCFFSPLLVLVDTCLVGAIYWMPHQLLLVSLIAFQVCGAAAVKERRRIFAYTSVLCVLPWGAALLPLPRKKTEIIEHIATGTQYQKGNCALDCAQAIDDCIAHAKFSKPNAQCVIFPESVFCHTIDEHYWAIDLWTYNALQPDTVFIFGTHRATDTGYCNSLCVAHKGRIIYYYDKIYPVPFIENLPYWWAYIPGTSHLFLKSKRLWRPACCDQLPLTVDLVGQSYTFVPALCSDLFFESPLLKRPLPILCLVNDNWFYFSYFSRLMLLFARLKACQWHREILYVGYAGAYYLQPNGSVTPI